jgi:polar amino acid transport system substrate-binding protein
VRRHMIPMFLLVVISLLPASCQSIPVVSTLDRVTEAGSVRIGVRNDNPPLSFIDGSGTWVGFDVDLAQALAGKLGVNPELVVVDGTTRISYLQDGRVDMSIASMNHTRRRDDAIDFSITYFWDRQSFLVRKGTYSTLEELFGKTVAANAGSSAIDSWRKYSAAAGAPEPVIVEFGDKLSAMQALRDGAIEGYTEDNITLLSLAAGDQGLELLSGGHNLVQFGIGVPVNDSRWRDAVNYALQDVWADGTYLAIYNKWFDGPDAPVRLPLSGQIEIWP